MATQPVVSQPTDVLRFNRGSLIEVARPPRRQRLFVVPKIGYSKTCWLEMTGSRREELSRETQLLLCCARTHLSAAYIDRIRLLLRPELNWASLISIAERAGLTPLVYEHLKRFESRVPSLWLERLEKASRTSTTRSLYLTAEMARVVELLESRGVPAIPYKGPVLAMQAYGDVALRQFHDMDVIVPQERMAEAHTALQASGYRARFPWSHESNLPLVRIPGEYTYRGEGSDCLLELHTELTMRHFPERINLDALRERLVNVPLGGSQVKTFCVEDELVILAVHGAKDFWQKLGWVVDLSELISSAGRVNWDVVFETATALNAERMLLLALSLASDLLDTRLPVPVFEKIQNDRTVLSLTEQVERKLLAPRPAKWNLAQRAWFRSRLVPGNIQGIGYVARLAAQPAEDEWTAAHGSVWSATMQAIARPFRMSKRHDADEVSSNENEG
jgi:Uncharacterised nucleotidyltransferase